MVNIFESNIVDYVCGCGHLNPITKLFFCRHCLKPRCGFCVCHEVRECDFFLPSLSSQTPFFEKIIFVFHTNQVDSHFCYNCLENIPSGEAKLKKYRCNKCFECPSCQHTLSSRATSVQVARAEGDAKADTSGASPAAEGEKSAAKTTTRKMYYLSCLACRWTSRDAGLPDQANGKMARNARHSCDFVCAMDSSSFCINKFSASRRQM